VRKNAQDLVMRRVRENHDKAESQVKQFLWSWAEPACETEEEFRLSSALFLQLLDSDQFAAAMQTTGAVDQVKDFYVRRIYPHLDHIVFYKRKHLLHFDTNSNSAHEGTNRGMKSHAAPTNPQHTLAKATKVLTHQACLKSLSLQSDLARKINSKTLWSEQPTQGHVVDLALNLIINEWEQRGHYDIAGPFSDADSEGIFWLQFRKDQAIDDSQDKHLGTVPRFKRVRKIHRCCETGTLRCDCCYFDRVGIPCRHIMALLCQITGSEFKGVAVDDVRVFWRNDYFFYGMQPRNDMGSLLLQLRDSDTQGPIVPIDKVPPTISMDENHPIVKTFSLPLVERCLNYAPLQCQAALQSHGSSIAPGCLGLNQEFFDYGDTADDDGSVLEFQTPTDATFSYPSPPKKDKTAHEQAYDLLKPKFDELVTLLGDSNADNTQITLYGDMLTEIIMRRRAGIGCQHA
jgi:hypothetical protein